MNEIPPSVVPVAGTPRPSEFISMVTVMNEVSAGRELDLFVREQVQSLDMAGMLMGMAAMSLLSGDGVTHHQLQTSALRRQQYFRVRRGPAPAAIRLLALMQPGDLSDNTPLEFLLEGSDVELDLLYLAPDLPLPEHLPPHDICMVAIAPAEGGQPLLEAAARLLRGATGPVFNRPERIAPLLRDRVSAMLQGIAGLAVPRMVRVTRTLLDDIGAGRSAIADALGEGDFPVIVRPLVSHTGQGLAKIEGRAELVDYLATRGEPDFFLAPFIDYASADGQYRKYRIALIAGRPHLCHMAISSRWMVHYLNAGMADSAAKRAEEAAAMAGFERDFAPRHGDIWREMSARLGLDYVVMDCAELPDGSLLLFELDNICIVHAMDSAVLYPYKREHMAGVFAAFRAMLAGPPMSAD
jgi:hypothetical protein